MCIFKKEYDNFDSDINLNFHINDKEYNRMICEFDKHTNKIKSEIIFKYKNITKHINEGISVDDAIVEINDIFEILTIE